MGIYDKQWLPIKDAMRPRVSNKTPENLSLFIFSPYSAS